ncbi:hypothetical protein [Streptomyces sp. NPDC050504]|uniref:hypothetical protein n=1 Tax=Streptomyces sp. NPDC050504 TaxID=3365618 RepID=UPI0037A832B4
MSGDNNYYGDNVNMYGGTGNTGIDKRQAAAVPGLADAVAELERLVGELRAQLAPGSARVVDEALPVIRAGAPEERHRALIAVATIAATVGAVGQPVAEAVRGVLGVLGVG